MNGFRKVLATCAAVIVTMASGVLVAHADSTPSVYDTPGGHESAGRLWDTTCEKYSSNVVRCRTDIWATQVFLQGGRYVKKTGWTFNNLSYLPSPRASWTGNNLGQSNNRWMSGGKTWKTECDTAVTGKGGCRSYVWTKQVQAKKTGSTWSYSNVEGWVFNNLVLFSSSKVPHVSTVPNWVVDCPGQWIEPKGLKCSPIRLGALGVDLQRLGYVGLTPDGLAYFPYMSQSVKNRGVWIEFGGAGDVHAVSLETGFIPTKAGARVGMTVGQVKAIYGAKFAAVPKENYGSIQYFGTVREGTFELQFRVNGELVEEGGVEYYKYAPTRPLVDSDVIAEISAQRYTDDASWEGVPQSDWDRGN